MGVEYSYIGQNEAVSKHKQPYKPVAATNGLVLPLFIQKFKDARPDIKYNSSVNASFDYVCPGAFVLLCCPGLLSLFNIRIYLEGLAGRVLLFAIFVVFAGYALTSLQGLRIFVFGLVL